jgi:glycerol-3-phosphate dehydrogenase (NAD(P)+)
LHEALAPLGVAPAIVGVAGPSIAREVANRALTAVVFAAADQAAGAICRAVLQTGWYRVRLAQDVIGVEVNAALKNFLTIGVSAAWAREPDRHRNGARQHNGAAAVFAQAVDELAVLTGWLGGIPDTAYGLAGAGDLFVTVNAGRNARLGACLAAGQRVSEVIAGPLAGETVEGIDTGRALGPALRHAWHEDAFLRARLPLTTALLAAILEDKPLGLDPSAHWRDEG